VFISYLISFVDVAIRSCVMRRGPALCHPDKKPIPKPAKRPRRFDPFWAEKDDVDEDGLTDNPDWLVGGE